VVVCSARSGESKQNGTTNRLIRAANFALQPGCDGYWEELDNILKEHTQVAHDMIQNDTIRKSLIADIEHDCTKLTSFLKAAQIINEISPRSRDIIIGAGEKLSCRIVAAVLQDRVIKGTSWVGGHSIANEHAWLFGRVLKLNLCLWRTSSTGNSKY
jgi:aspartate kinase